MNQYDRDTRSSSATDSVAVSIPIDVRADSINPDVVSALDRWRHVDPHSLNALNSALWTHDGVSIADSPAYLRALHGFVAEKVAFDDLSPAHHVIWPEQTNVPAYDMIVNGTPTQIKEGTTAYQQVQHASDRYPNVNSFITDPETAERLRAHGVDALGINGLDPSEIAATTRNSALGLDALEHAGQLHIPLLTTLFAICKYWERYDSENIDLATAVKFASADIGAQSLGAAAGLKLAAIYVVATGGFGIAALPLTAGAMLGAFGLRHLVGRSRGRRLSEAIDHLELTRQASEMTLDIISERSRDFAGATVKSAMQQIHRANQDGAATYARSRRDVFTKICTRADNACRELMREQSMADRFALRFSKTFAEAEPERRFLAIISLLEDVEQFAEPSSMERTLAGAWLRDARSALEEIDRRLNDIERSVSIRCKDIERETCLELISEYGLLLECMARAAEPVARAFETVETEAKKLGTSFSRA